MGSERALLALAAATLAPRLPALYRAACRRGRLAVLAQALAVVTCLRSGARLPAALHPAAIPTVTLAALGLDAARGARGTLWAVLTAGMVPSLVEAMREGWDGLASGEADVPALLAMQLGLCLNQVRAAAVILLMLTGGEAFEEFALRRAGRELHSLLARRPGMALRRTGESVAAEAVRPGDLLLVRRGEPIPVDGHVVSTQGQSVVDEALLTGERGGVRKGHGDLLLAGAHNMGDALVLCCVKPYHDSVLALMKAKLAEALETKAELELSSKRFAAWFTPLTLAVAGLSTLISAARGRSGRETWDTVLAVLMAATPCPAAIGVPIAMLSGMSVASRQLGATVKSGTALEALSRVTAVVLDKTGTLTEGAPSVTRLDLDFDPARLGRHRVLQLLASVEQLSTHPLAAAICAVGTGPPSLDAADFVQDCTGVSAIVDARFQVRVGTWQHCFLNVTGAEVPALNTSEAMQAYFWIGDRSSEAPCAAGCILFQDQLRTSAQPMVDALRRAGVHLCLLSGDRSGHLGAVATQLGIQDVASCWPHEKAQRVQDLRAAGHVVMVVGDGANDAVALAAADVGLSVGASNLAAESASVVLMNSDLGNVPRLISLSRGVVRVATRTVYGGTTVSVVQMVAAAAGFLPPFASAVCQELVDLGAVLHSLQVILF